MSEDRAGLQRCRAVKKNGDPCGANPGRDGYCIGHRPGSAEARSKGGAASSRASRAAKLLPARLRPVGDLLDKALREVYEGSLEPRVGTAMAALAGALVKVHSVGELEERMKALESRLRDES